MANSNSSDGTWVRAQVARLRGEIDRGFKPLCGSGPAPAPAGLPGPRAQALAQQPKYQAIVEPTTKTLDEYYTATGGAMAQQQQRAAAPCAPRKRDDDDMQSVMDKYTVRAPAAGKRA